MFGVFIGYFLTIGLLAGLIAALCVFSALSTHEEKVKQAKKTELANSGQYQWSWEIRKAVEKWEEEYDKTREKYWVAALIFVIAIIFFVAGIFTYADYQFEQMSWEEVNYVTHQIVNLADNSEINGRISGSRRYTSGYIGEITVYQYYYVTARGSWDLQKSNEATTEFFPTDGQPCAKWYRIHKKFWWNEETKYRCDIYIPKDAMITDFIIDME